MYILIVLIYLQAIFIIKGQCIIDCKDLIADMVSVLQNVEFNAYEWM